MLLERSGTTHVQSEKRFLNVQELANYLGLSRWTIYSLVNKREIPFIPLSRKALRFDRGHIDKWMERKEIRTSADFVG